MLLAKNEKLGPILHLKDTKIYGESNILRYFSRLLPGNASHDKSSDSIGIEEWIDKCTNELRLAPKLNVDAYLGNLNRVLTDKCKFLTSDKATIADLYNWSILTQLNAQFNGKFSNICQWVKRLEESFPILSHL